MSWFKRIPHRYPPVTPVPAPHRSSPAAERALEQYKENGPKKQSKDKPTQ